MSVSSLELKSKIYRAGAGAGKTYTLVHEVLKLARDFYAHEGRYPQVVVTTFTRKATEELRERLMQKVLEGQEWELVKFVSSRSQLHISTIHGVLSAYLTRHGHVLGVDPSFKVMAKSESERLARRVLKQLLVQEPVHVELLESFSVYELAQRLQQYAAALHHWPDLRAANEEIFLQVDERVRETLAERLQVCAGGIKAQCPAWAESWKSFADELISLARHCLHKGGTRQEIAEFWAKLKVPQNRARKGEYPISGELQREWEDCKRELKEYLDNSIFARELWPKFFAGWARFEKLGRDFVTEFSRAKMSAGEIDMLDLELLALRGLREHPDSARAFAAGWDYWFIDEFQDTSPLQVELFEHLVGDRPRFIVGDPQQSIYLFRGADVEVFRRAQEEISRAGGEYHELLRNYRSQAELLLFLNDFFSGLRPPFSPMQPKPAVDGTLTFEANKTVAYFAVPPLNPSADEDQPPDLKSAQAGELAALGQHIEKLLSGGARLDEICVLARKRSQLAEVAVFLSQHGYPVQVHASAGFWQKREIKDCVCLLGFLVNPHDNKRLVELLRSPWFLVADDILAEVAFERQGAKESLWQTLQKKQWARSSDLSAITRLLELQEYASQAGLAAAVQRAIVQAGVVDWSHKHDSTGQRESNLWKFIHRLYQEERRPGCNFLEFLRGAGSELSLDGSGNEDGEAVAALEPNRINLMTVHGAKGLQFAHLVIPFCDRAQKVSSSSDFPFVVDPDRRAWSLTWPILPEEEKKWQSPLGWEFVQRQCARERKESVRLLYVALTRAQKTVFLSWAGPAQKDSWLNEIHWPLACEGRHTTPHYTYEVACGPWQVAHWQAGKDAPIRLRAPFAELKEREITSDEPIDRERVSVTSLVAAPPPQQAIFARHSGEQVMERLLAAQRGTLMHRLFELIKYSSGEDLSAYVGQWFAESGDEVMGALRFVMASTQPPLLALIQNGRVEWGFLYRDGETVIEGQIDLWGEVDGQMWVVDYKTGHSRYSEKAFTQLNHYAQALHKMGYVAAIEAIHLAVIYPFEQKVVWRAALAPGTHFR